MIPFTIENTDDVSVGISRVGSPTANYPFKLEIVDTYSTDLYRVYAGLDSLVDRYRFQ